MYSERVIHHGIMGDCCPLVAQRAQKHLELSEQKNQKRKKLRRVLGALA